MNFTRFNLFDLFVYQDFSNFAELIEKNGSPREFVFMSFANKMSMLLAL